tara:strand:- start:72 stop:809 length:738 start_codon:yes stop_codon:yes gene_type:complete
LDKEKINTKVDILIFGAHPDDIELACSGTILKHLELGYKIGLIDLTHGELGTRGSKELRQLETQKANSLMNISFRINLDMKDGFFEINESNKIKIISYLRYFQPRIVIANAKNDRHPDHGRASDLVKTCCFLSGLPKVETIYNREKQNVWRPSSLYYYTQFNQEIPDFVVDISNYIDKKVKIIKSYSSQFYNPKSREPETIISKKSFLDSIIYRSADLGRIINVEYAEGFKSERYICVNDLLDLK